MSVLRRVSDKLSMFRRAIAMVGITNAMRLELSRIVFRLGLTGIWPVFAFSLPNSDHKVYLRTGTSDYNAFLHVFGRETYGPSLQPGSIPKLIIDCGSNVGYSSVFFLNRFPGVTIVAVEPEPDNMRICEMNLAPYGDNVRLSKSAVWSSVCTLDLVRPGRHREQCTRVREPLGTQTFTVPAVDIPTLIELGGGGTVDLLKIDIEGSELQLFTKNTSTWLPRIRNIAIELHGPNCRNAFFRALKDYDYQLVSSGDTTICRNVIAKCVKRPEVDADASSVVGI